MNNLCKPALDFYTAHFDTFLRRYVSEGDDLALAWEKATNSVLSIAKQSHKADSIEFAEVLALMLSKAPRSAGVDNLAARWSTLVGEIAKRDKLTDWGVAFNKLRNPYYKTQGGASEVTVRLNGQKYPRFLDSYIPGKEIVSRKWTQLTDGPAGLGHLDEFVAKYADNTVTIPNPPTKRIQKLIDDGVLPATVPGSRITGRYILEVPVQNQAVHRSILEKADELGVTIRDPLGRVYDLANPAGRYVD